MTCETHGVVQVLVPWAEPRSRLTVLFERLAIDVLWQFDVRGATRLLRITWDEAWQLLTRVVARGQRRKGSKGIVNLTRGWQTERHENQNAQLPTPSLSIRNFSHAVWLYHRFCLGFREVEELLAERGITVTYETIRQWCQKFGPA